MTNMDKKFLGLAIVIAVSMVISVGLLAGCTAKETSQNSGNNGTNEKGSITEQQDIQSKAMTDFDALMGSNPEVDKVIDFIDENMAKLTKENVSSMLMKLEELQKKELPSLEERYYSTEAIQTELQTIYSPEFDINDLDAIKDQGLKDLLTETRETGYKAETAEGMVFPVMNYGFYKKYSNYVTEDIAAYIEIMAVESDKTPVKDAGLMIGWDEIIKRVLVQEQFLKKHEDSVKAPEVQKLQNRYVVFMTFGTNNTPLFDYDTKIMRPEAQAAYLKAVGDNKDSGVMQLLGEYLDILSKTDYKFSDEAEKFRKDAVEDSML